MGLRYRKSVRLFGGALRINFSKSGIGYSYGGKLARVTKTANGRTRYTTTLPGTGISYVTETGGTKRKATKSSPATTVSLTKEEEKDAKKLLLFFLVYIVLWIATSFVIATVIMCSWSFISNTIKVRRIKAKALEEYTAWIEGVGGTEE